jgi:Leucine-rich repeat (LRR) protein
MESLQLLDLSFNMLKQIDKYLLKQFPALRELNVSVNQIDFITHDFFKGSKNLRVVDLSSNKLDQTIDPQAFHHLPKNLQYFDFSSKSKKINLFP